VNGAASPFTCPLCGFRFREGAAACDGCPLSGGCDTACCPHCGYRFVTGSRILGTLRRWLGLVGSSGKETAP
jgi:hypothetical protein